MTLHPGLPLPEPVGPALRQALLFAGVSLHLVFVLLALGTALLAVVYFIEGWRTNRPDELRWDKTILRTFMIHKSLAVVLGVGPLLLLQVGRPRLFLTSAGLMAPFWLLIIVFLMIASLSFDSLAHRIYVHRAAHLAFGLLALALFLTLPGIFAAVLTSAEHAESWLAILRDAGRFRGALGLHWALRYLHVLAAAAILGGLFHYFATSGGDPDKRRKTRTWALGGAAAQLVFGPLLAVTVSGGWDRPSVAFLAAGIAALAAFFAALARGRAGRPIRPAAAAATLAAVLLAMFALRQHRQDLAFSRADAAAPPVAAAGAVPTSFTERSVARYFEELETVYDNGPTIYDKSCAVCHGRDGDGRGPDASRLAVPPEDLAAIRAERGYLLRGLARGVTGTGMPYFSVFVRPILERLVDHLDARFGLLGRPPEPETIPEADRRQAEATYASVCAACHGPDGRPTPSARAFAPPPPDFTKFGLLPARALEVIEKGYPGTMMAAYGPSLPPGLRRALAAVIAAKRVAGGGRP